MITIKRAIFFGDRGYSLESPDPITFWYDEGFTKPQTLNTELNFILEDSEGNIIPAGDPIYLSGFFDPDDSSMMEKGLDPSSDPTHWHVIRNLTEDFTELTVREMVERCIELELHRK